jgi:molecular chaperone DnaK
MGIAIGIDLGTTNSCAAVFVNGTPEVITYRNGSKTIPSVFAIDKSGNRLIGEEAVEQAAANPLNTVTAAKRLIGREYGGHAMEKMQQVFTYELVEGESSEVLVKIKNQVFTLEQISAAILRRIRDNAEDVLGKAVDKAVITVPAYFNDRQRQAVRTAGKLAGLEVLRVLNEPTAAALAYGLGRKLHQRVAIYDLGGGTFDISIIDIQNKVFEVIATGGDTFLGGVDFDDRVMQYVLGSFLNDTGYDLSYDRSAVTRVRQEAETAKIRLSDEDEVVIDIPNICKDDDGEPMHLKHTLRRSQLEKMTGDLVARSIQTCDRILAESGTSKSELDEVLLVGGQSRMPLVQTQVGNFIGKTPSDKVHPDEAVAIGAAIMAYSLAGKQTDTDMTLLDVLPMPIGINKTDGSMHILFPKNQPLPDYKNRTLTTSKNNQRSIMLRIYQGDSKFVRDNQLLGRFVFSGLRPGPKGSVRVEVTFHIDSEGILNLTARDADTGQMVESQVKLDRDDKPAAPVEPVDSPTTPDETEDVVPLPLTMPQSSLAAPGQNTADTARKSTPVPVHNKPAQPSEKEKAAEVPAQTDSLGFFGTIRAWFKSLFAQA